MLLAILIIFQNCQLIHQMQPEIFVNWLGQGGQMVTSRRKNQDAAKISNS